MSENLLEFINVSKSYDKTIVLDCINFAVPNRSIITLVGPNGAGKTTIAKLMLGSELPNSGQINKAKDVRFGYVPQKININSNMPMTVKYLLDTLTKNSAIDDYSNEILDFAQIKDIADLDISKLSGGQVSRVFLASCLINKANLIILDEPTKELDIIGQNHFYQLLAQIKQNFNSTIFIISHDLHTVINASDQVLCLNQHLCCYGKPVKQYQDILEHIGFYKHHHNHTHR
jgi:zinc transport system ATP-binding protein